MILGLAWPWIEKPASVDCRARLRYERDGFSFYFPLTTSLIVSLVVSLLLWLLRR